MISVRNETLLIIPAFNEEKNIELVINNIIKENKNVDVLVVNDGSVDKTAEILENKDIFVINHLFNMGIGVSFETGCQFALENEYKYIVRMDGDGQHDPSFINDVLAPVRNKEADITIGSRFLGNSKFTSSRFRLLGICIISLILTMITKRKVSDPTSGFCAMNKKAFEFFSKNCVEDYPEPEILVFHKEFKIKEIPISITKRIDGISSITPIKSVYYMLKVCLSLCMHTFRD